LSLPSSSSKFDFRGRRLLILGGNRETGALVEVANQLGLYTIVVDPNPQAPAKKYAASSYDIDGFDVDGVVDLATRLRVEGVLVGVADILVAPYTEICRRLSLPCYSSKSIVEAFCSKDGFGEACRRFGVRDIPGMVVERNGPRPDLALLTFPVMVKPVDSGAGVGMRVCRNPLELMKCIDTSLSSSRMGRVLVERYMSGDDIFAYYTIKNGRAYLSACADRITSRSQGNRSPVCIAAIYPSRHVQAFLQNGNPGIIRMIEGLGVRNGVLNIQFFVENREFFAYDPGFRIQGEAPHIPIMTANGFDHRVMLLSFALTGSMGVPDFEERNDVMLHGKRACTVWVLLKSGVIGKIQGLDALRRDPGVAFVLQRFSEREQVADDMVGTERQVLARIYLVSDSVEKLAARVQNVRSEVSVVDSLGNDMIVEWVSPDAITR
jgi:biotin carboxylase